MLAKGFNALHFVASLSAHLRDLVVARTAGLEALLELPDSLKRRYAEQSARCSLQFLYDALNITTACEAGYKAATYPRLHIEFALMKLSFLSGAAGVSLQPARPAAAAAPAAKPAGLVSAAPAAKAPAAPAAPTASAAPAAASAAPAALEPVPVPGASGPAPAPTAAPTAQPAAPVTPASAAQPTVPASAATPVAEPAAPTAPAHTAPTPAASASPAQAAPQPRRRAKTGAALSIGAIMEEKEEQAGNEADAVAPAAVKKLEEAPLREAWQKLAELYSSRQRLASTLASAQVNLVDEEGTQWVEFYVVNVSQKQWIEEKLLRELEGNLFKLTRVPNVRIRVLVTPETELKERVPYMPEDQAKDLMAKNAAVRDFIAELGLDVK